MLTSALKHRTLVWQLLRRDIHSRYRGSVLGLLWSLVTPLVMLAIYTFVFQFVFKARWSDAVGETTLNFAIILFLGLSIHAVLTEVLTKSPALITGNPNFVKKIVFPLEVLPWINLFGALFTFSISFCLLLMFILIEQGRVPATTLLLPFVLAPYFFMLLGISWWLAALGVYLRDIQQITGTLATLLLFLSPVFYSVATLPLAMQKLIYLNPLAYPVEASRQLLIYGQVPEAGGLVIYGCTAIVVAWLGSRFFKLVRPGFADVL